MAKIHTHFRGFYGSSEHRLVRKELSDTYKEVNNPKASKGSRNFKNETDKLVMKVKNVANVGWLSAINNFRLSTQKYRKDVLYQQFLEEADKEITTKTNAAVKGISSWFRWTKHAEYMTLKHRVALQKCEAVKTRLQERNGEIQRLLDAHDVAQELRGYEGPAKLGTKATQAFELALDGVKAKLESAVAKNTKPTPVRFESALADEPRAVELLKYFKIVPDGQIADYLKKNENGSNALIKMIEANPCNDEFNSELPGGKKALLKMVKGLQKAKGYSAFKLARPDVNALGGDARFRAVLEGNYYDSKLTFRALPDRPQFTAKIIGRDVDDPNALILEAPSPKVGGGIERVVLGIDEKDGLLKLAYKGSKELRLSQVKDSNFFMAA